MEHIPISPYTINLILQYISPPSQLVRPIPPHLLSRSLLKRHALLEISPQDPSAYLSWPSSESDLAIQHLESLQMPLDDQAPDFLVGYTVDPENAYAHVHVKPTGDNGLRLIFEWDGEESWKYHDSTLMPFPPGTRPFLDDPAARAASDFIPSPSFRGERQVKGATGDGDDDYWNSYGAEDDVKPLPSTSKGEADVSEDAYWARYAAVQGTSDSTIPSPIHKRARKLEIVPVAHHISREEISHTLNPNLRPLLRDPKAPPSPTTLAHRLTHISPRPSNNSPLSHRPSAAGPDEDTPGVTDDSSETPASLLDDENPWEWGIVQKNRKDRNESSATTTDTASSSRQRVDQDDDSRALQDAVRGLFWLWKIRQRPDLGEGKKTTEELDRAEFLHLVSRAIATPK